ncbi:MAG: hypothetical protein WAX80_01135 [Minisyncoccia bacterium]
MRKTIISLIIVLSIALIGLLGWYLLSRNTSTPVAETVLGILPFGEGGGDSTRPTTNDLQPTTGASDQGDQQMVDEFGNPSSDLFRISNTPIAGAVMLKRGSETVVRYADRATGHIYDVDLATLVKTKVTNNTLPKIYEAYFRPDGNAVLFRSLKEDSDMVENLSLALIPPKATSTDNLYTVSSTLLRGDISSVAVGSGNGLFYALRDTSSIVSSAFNGTGIKTLLTSSFTDWRLAMAGNSLVAYTKASANVPGYAYSVNTSNGTLTKIVGPLSGLVVVPSPVGNRVLYSYIDNTGAKMFAKNLTNNTSSEISPATLAEKCVWSTKKAGSLFCGTPINDVGAGEPDNWYRGVTHFSDYIWRFDTGSEIAQLIAEPKKSLDVDIDLIDLKLSPDEDYLIFTNKNDLSLWGLRLQ